MTPPVAASPARPTRRVASASEWQTLLRQWGSAVPAPSAPVGRYRRIVVPTLVGASHLFALREGLLGHALRLRGAEVVFVLCDGLPACDARTYDNDPPDLCTRCVASGEASLRALGHRVVRASTFVDPARVGQLLEEARDWPPEDLLTARHDGFEPGADVFASTMRYLRAGRWEAHDPETLAKGRQYLATALVMHACARSALERLRPDKVLLSHGIYTTWGSWMAAAREAGVPFDVGCGGWRRNTLLFQHDSTTATHCNDLWPEVETTALSAAEEARVDEYLATREDTREDYFQYVNAIQRDRQQFAQRYGVDRQRYRRVVGLFTNVAFDGARLPTDGPFPDMFDWVDQVVRRAPRHPDTLFLLKAHPAEVHFVESTPEHWRVLRVLQDRIASLPPNVRLVPPDDPVSPFAVYDLIDAGLVNTSSVGLELALRGLPVLTTGAGAHYEKPGIVLVPGSREEYFAHFDRLACGQHPFAPDAARTKRYAFALWFRKSIPFEPLEVRGWRAVGVGIDTLADLRPGRFTGLDTICRGVLDGGPFALAGEEVL